MVTRSVPTNDYTWYKMIVSHHHKLIFIHVQKTAGTSVSTFMQNNLRAIVDGKKHESASEAKSRIPADVWDSYYKIAFVRNPWDRLVSWYHHMRLHYTKPGDNPFWDYLMSVGDSFDSYVRYGDKTIITPWGARNLFTNQYDQLSCEDRLLVDYVGKYEQLDVDWRAIMDYVGFRAGAKLPRDNRIERNPYQQYYTDETRLIVAQKFRKDIETFRYSF